MAQSVVIVGTITDSEGNTKQVTINGMGTIMPESPPGIWGGGNVPMPTPPIYIPPVVNPPPGVVAPPIYYPPGISGPPGPWPTPPIYFPPAGGPPVVAPPIYYPPEASHPIVLPEPPEVPTEPPIAPPGGGISEGWQWYYSPVYGWILVWLPPGGGGKPQPPGGSQPVVTPHK
jgi:hypothetical protein